MNEIQKKVTEMLSNKFSTSESDITLKTDIFDDLAADSLDVVELVSEMEKAYDIVISTEEAESLRTVEDVVKMIESKKQA